MKKTVLTVVTLIVMISFSGCSGQGRLTDMTIIQGIGIDCDKNNVIVTVQYLDINKGIGTNEGVKGNITAISEGKGNSIKSAIGDAEKTLPDKMFYGQNKLLVLTDDSEQSLRSELKEFMSDTKYSRPDILVVKSTTTAAEIISNKQLGSRVP
ncbi:MAG: hypothetical protein K6C14_07040, partial [Eubacterium sp.]|nr:hypothetical protein [Eubacterium sp.]